MPTPLEQQCSTILYAASSSTFGLVLKTDDPMEARASLYHTRQLIGDPILASLQIRVSPDDSEHEIWLIRKKRAPVLTLSNIPPEDLL